MKQWTVTIYYQKESGLFPTTILVWAHGRAEAESRAMLTSDKTFFAVCRD
jgi:hypothetical protein